jgi:AraC-like DNA-binding protein
VGELAESVGLSEPRFSHLFAITTGILPGEHLRILREYREEQQMAAEILAEIE